MPSVPGLHLFEYLRASGRIVALDLSRSFAGTASIFNSERLD
jgi:hypothetical protein